MLEEINQYRRRISQQHHDVPAAVRNIEILKYANERLLQHINVCSYDVIHSNNGISSFVANKLVPEVPLIGTVHGIYHRESLLMGYASSPEEAAWLRIYDKYAVECPTLVHTVSHVMKEYLEDINKDKHIVIHNGLDLSQFHPTFQTNKPLRIAGVGHINYLKGYDLLVQAIHLLIQQGVNGFEVVLYGDGPLRAELEEESKRMNLPITFRGMVPRLQLYTELPGYDIFVHPSRTETFGLAVTEAMASGCAVICTRIGGLIEQVIGEDNGLLFELEDVEGLAQCIRRLVTEDGLRERLRRRGVEVVQERFSLDDILEKFERAYEKTIQLHSTSGLR